MKEGGSKEVRRVVGGAAKWEPGWGRGKAGSRTGSAASWRAMSLHSQTFSSDHRCVTPPGSAGGGALVRGPAPSSPAPRARLWPHPPGPRPAPPPGLATPPGPEAKAAPPLPSRVRTRQREWDSALRGSEPAGPVPAGAMSRNLRTALIFGGFISLIGAAFYPIYFRPLMRPEEYSE